MDNFVVDKQEQKIQELEQQVQFWKSEYENLKIRYDALQKKLTDNEESKLSTSVASLSFGLVTDDHSDTSSVDSASVENLKLPNEDIDEPESEWALDEDYEACPICSSKFHAFRRRHHCRRCGRIFCSKCSSHFIVLPGTPSTDEQRCCDICYNLITQMQKISSTP